MTKDVVTATPFVARLLLAVSIAGSALLLAGRVWASLDDGATAPEASRQQTPATEEIQNESLSGIDITFKVDPRLTRSLYMGDRWISPPTYTLYAPAPDATVDARVHGVDATGKRVDVEATWTPSDPEMVTVAPAEASEVTITVHRTGESRLRVSAGGVSRELTVRGTQGDPAFQVEIVQVPLEGTAEAEERARILEGPTEKASYALGMDLGRKLKEQSVEVDTDSLANGVADALEGKTLLTEDELKTALDAYHGQLQARQMREQLLERRRALAERSRERVVRRKELAEKNKTEGEAFLAENGAREGVVTLESGLQYRVLEEGDGVRPTAEDTVVCHYQGTLIDGMEFDSSHKRGKPGTFALNRVVRGWREALQLMPVGSKWQLFIPPELGYGRSGTRGIPPNATLVFEVELLSIQGPRARRQKKEEASPPDVATTAQTPP